jgi:hypothetical protein
MKIKSKDIEAVENLLTLEVCRAQTALAVFKFNDSVAQMSHIDSQEQIEEFWRTASPGAKWLYIAYIGTLIAPAHERKPSRL